MLRICFLIFVSLLFASSIQANYGAASYANLNQQSGYCYDNTGYGGGCRSVHPGTTPYFWRFIDHIGYRKYTPMGAMYHDWYQYQDYLRTNRGVRREKRFRR